MIKKIILILIPFILTVSLCFSEENDSSKQYKNTNAPFSFHGRLQIYNGNPCFRIFIIGTNRILGVPGGDLEPADMPKELDNLFTETSIIIYGDFSVTPLTEYKEGEMQLVRIDTVKNLIIYNGDKFIKKQDKL